MTHQLSLGQGWQLFPDPNGLMNKTIKKWLILHGGYFLHLKSLKLRQKTGKPIEEMCFTVNNNKNTHITLFQRGM